MSVLILLVALAIAPTLIGYLGFMVAGVPGLVVGIVAGLGISVWALTSGGPGETTP